MTKEIRVSQYKNHRGVYTVELPDDEEEFLRKYAELGITKERALEVVLWYGLMHYRNLKKEEKE